MDDEDLNAEYERHQLLRRQLPAAWSAFFARFGSLRPIQLQALPPILAGRNVLVTAPTAGGKTEAVIAPLCERIVAQRWAGLSVLLVTPTRALVNDLFLRLEHPCNGMRVRLGRKTADHGLSDQVDDQLLVTTPESLESLLTFRRAVLPGIRAVVVDEIHLLDGTPRGDQLRVLLARLSAYLHDRAGEKFTGLQAIAMSATVSDPRRLADAYLGRGAQIVAVPGHRVLDTRIVVADGEVDARVRAAVTAIETFADVRKVLVFFNSRKEVDVGTGCFQHGTFAHVPVFGHHGSLSKDQREQTESRFRSESRAVCVATMTLEVGIDIGDIDLVVCMDPPFSLASFLQRIGRGCRRLAGRTRVVCVARNRGAEILFESMIRQGALGLPAGPLKPFRTSVLVQQALAYLRQVDQNCRTVDQFERVFASANAPPISADRLKELLADMLQQGLLDRRGHIYQPASKGSDFIQSSRIYSNIAPTPFEISLVDADTGKVVAIVAAAPEGHVRIAGRSYEVVGSNRDGQQRIRGADAPGGSPRYQPVALPYAADLGAAIAGRLEIPVDTLAVVTAGGGLVVMTWLGKLLNSALAEWLHARAFKVKPHAFSLVVNDAEASNVLKVLSTAVDGVIQDNPLSQMKVERMADLGPYFSELSPSMQQLSRRDWLDADYLRKWCSTLRRVLVTAPESAIGRDLLALP